MECPTCHAWIARPGAHCPRCGALLELDRTAAEQLAAVVESTAERGPISAELPLPMEGELAYEDAGTGTGAARTADTRLVVRGQSLPAVLWQQPAVRAVAQVGAGAIALSLGMRLLRAWLARPRAVRGAASSALPVFADLLQGPQGTTAPLRELARPERGAEVVETFVYMRRVRRRR
jgi:hypothetical protein